jgi:hypothetical protein
MIVEAGRQYRSRRGERVQVTAVDTVGDWPVHFIVMDGRYQGVGLRDGSRLKLNGRATEAIAETYVDHWNDLVSEWSADPSNSNRRDVLHRPYARKRESTRRVG